MNFFKGLFNTKSVLNAYQDSGELVEISGELRTKFQRELKNIVVDILETCQKYNIAFFLCGGSALGAIRHKGFIPWDDDVDIAMSREDYLRFVKVFDKEMSTKYILNAPNYSEQVIARFPKVLLRDSCLISTDTPIPELQKIYVDIFIMDNIPRNAFVRRIKGFYCNAIEFITSQVWMVTYQDDYIKKAYQSSNNVAYLIKKCIGTVFSYRSVSEWNDRIDRYVQYSKNTGLVGFPTGRHHYFGEVFEVEELLPSKIKMQKFEDVFFPILEKTDIYLAHVYGDYMRIPPEDKRERHFVKAVGFRDEFYGVR